MEMILSVLFNMVATNHLWLLSNWKDWCNYGTDFKIYLLTLNSVIMEQNYKIQVNLNLDTHMWLVASMLGSAGLHIGVTHPRRD